MTAKFDSQYVLRLPGSRLVPLVAEAGGRWHPSVAPLLRQLAREYIARTPGLLDAPVSPVLSRWVARLSATLMRGNAAIVHGLGARLPCAAPRDAAPSGPLPAVCPEGDSAYELLVGRV